MGAESVGAGGGEGTGAGAGVGAESESAGADAGAESVGASAIASAQTAIASSEKMKSVACTLHWPGSPWLIQPHTNASALSSDATLMLGK